MSLAISIIPATKRLSTSYKGKEITWQYSVWGRLNTEPTERIFGATNDYLATLPEAVQDDLWACYEEANDLLLSIGNLKTLESDLITIVNRMSQHFDFDHLLNWAVTKGNILPDTNIEERNNTTNPDSMHYVRQDAHEMAVFCVLVKLITPIWGPYINHVKDEVGNLQKERIAARIFAKSAFSEMRPYVRIQDYLTILAEVKTKNINTAMMYGLPKTDLDSFLMGLTLTRRFTVIPLRAKGQPSIVAYVFKFLEDKITQLGNGPYRDKFPLGQGTSQESDSFADQYRISQDVSDMIPIEIEYYLEDVPRICETMGLDETGLEDVVALRRALKENKRFKIIDVIHEVIPALVFRHVVSPALHRHLCRDARLTLIAVTAVYCHVRGLTDITRLLTAVKQPLDLTEMEMGTQNGQQLRRMSKELEDALNDRYPHRQPSDLRNGTNPGRNIIEEIVKFINAHDWLGLDDVSEIRNSLATLFIEK